MAKISNTTNYPTKGSPAGTDYVIGTDASSKETKTFTLQSIANLYAGSGSGTVTSVGLSGGTTGLTITSDTTSPITTTGTFTIGGTLATANGGTGLTSIGTAGQVLKVNSGATGLEWGAGGSGTPYTAGDGLELTGSEFSTDLKANGGLVIESTELAVDLGASSITGTLAVADGGTGATTLTTGNVLIGNGSSISFLNTAVKGTMLVGEAGATAALAVGTDGHVLTAASAEGVGVRWTAATVNASNITGTLGVDKGGTGATTLTGVLKGNGTGAITGSSSIGDLSNVSFSSSTNDASMYIGNGAPSGLVGTPTKTTAVGEGAGFATTSASSNTLIGTNAGLGVTTGGTNTLIGADSGDTLTTGAGNVLLGTSADTNANNVNAGIAIGKNTIVSTGSIAIGDGAQATGSSAGIAIGRGAATTNNRTALGSSSYPVKTGTPVDTEAPTGYIEIEINGDGTSRYIPYYT